MANLGGAYDASGGETMDDRSALPPGDYVAALVKSEKKDNKAGTGAYINCEFEVKEGEHQNRRFWTMLNLWNANTQAVEIAQRELNSMMHACGKLRIEDTDELLGIPLLVKLGVRTQPGYDPQNTVKSYKPMGGATSAPPAGSSGQSSGGKVGPWKQSA